MPRCSLGRERAGRQSRRGRQRGRFTHAAMDARPPSLAPRVAQVEAMLSGAPPPFSRTACAVLRGGGSGKTLHPTFMAAKQAGPTRNWKRLVFNENKGCGLLSRNPSEGSVLGEEQTTLTQSGGAKMLMHWETKKIIRSELRLNQAS